MDNGFWYQFKPPVAKTVREMQLENLLKECLPYIVREELSTRTSATLRSLIDDIRQATNTGNANNE